ncbi:MAG: biotin--[acetyl-CoA-carboxylase] ligase, partial [Planctomycetota bacterium]|nr:biotin--[acetyl-CoA-carboxylase] ligase [Planctomycetota bacterium]
PATLPAERTPILSLLAGLAARRAVAALAPGREVKVKWPNDVYLDGRKVCGILAEVPSPASGRIVIGIGINANNSLDDAPDEVRRRAVSMREATGRPIDVGELLVAALINLEEELSYAARAGELPVERWLPHCLLDGRAVCLRTPRGEVTGRCVGVASTGELLLETATGRRSYTTGEVIRF